MSRALVRSNFLDSGAFSVFKKAIRWAKETGNELEDYYDTEEFYEFMDGYATFVKKYQIAIDKYATVDALFNPEISYRNQRYLEDKHELSPVPVVHYKSDLKWLEKYIARGHRLIGIGGLARSVHGTQSGPRNWLDKVFDYVCDNKKRLPIVRLHGFGFTSYRMIVRYPWYSIDSSVWSQAAGYGNMYIPHKRGGKFVFDLPPYTLKVTENCKGRAKRGHHVHTVRPAERNIIQGWLDFIGVPYGNDSVEGVSNSTNMRRKVNLIYFQMLADAQPEWPWAFRSRPIKRTFGYDVGRKQ